MEVGEVGSSSSSLYYSPEVMGKEDFLRLLTLQLKYQDPMEPLKNEDFLAQLAQFSSLEQLLNINGNLQANFLLMQSLNNSLAANFIGKQVKASGNEVYLGEEGDVRIYYQLADSAKVTVKIYDAEDNLVRVLSKDEWQVAGDREIVWDGMDSYGKRLPKGKYTFKVYAVDSDGNSVGVIPFIQGKVTGIKFSDGFAVLLLGEVEVQFSDILEISE